MGGVVSTTVTRCVQVPLFPLQSVMRQTRVMTLEQTVPLVSVLAMANVMFVPQQSLVAVGTLKVHAEPHSTVLLVAQWMKSGAVQGLVEQHCVNETLSMWAPPSATVLCGLPRN